MSWSPFSSSSQNAKTPPVFICLFSSAFRVMRLFGVKWAKHLWIYQCSLSQPCNVRQQDSVVGSTYRRHFDAGMTSQRFRFQTLPLPPEGSAAAVDLAFSSQPAETANVTLRNEHKFFRRISLDLHKSPQRDEEVRMAEVGERNNNWDVTHMESDNGANRNR